MFARLKAFFSALHMRMPAHLREALSEDGIGSYSRYAGAFSIFVGAFWVTYIVLKTGHIPDLGGVATWVASGQSPYAANQAKKVASAIKGTPSGEQQ
jgi:hypothetical protein